MRSFIALPIPETTLDPLTRVQSAIPVGRPVAEDNLHLTLAFLGDVDEPGLQDLHLSLQSLRAAPVDITFDGLDSFTEMERGLVYAAVRNTPQIKDLHAAVARAARAAGLTLPRRRFRPHVTLTRANRRPDGVARDRLAAMMGQAAPDIPPFAADRMCLYRSDLTPSGARHEVLAEYPLIG
ncbi:MAG: RNA 2',3'-cyclic phosphodiesterase [Pseudomonadota bacterium]